MAAPSETTDAEMAKAEFTPQADVVDQLGALDMSRRLRDMLLGHDLPNALPLAYSDLRTRIDGSREEAVAVANSLAESLRITMKHVQEHLEAIATRLQRVHTENERLRLELNTLKRTVAEALDGGTLRPPPAPVSAGPSAPQPSTLPAGTNSGPWATAPVPLYQSPASAGPSRNVSFAPSVVAETIPATRADASVQSSRAAPFPAPTTSLPYPFAPPSRAEPLPPGPLSYGQPTAARPARHLPYPDVEAYRQPSSSDLPATLTAGPEVPGLTPMMTLLEPFRFVVDYRTYRLTNQREEPYQNELENLDGVVNRTKKLYPSMVNFDGGKPLRLLGLFHTLKKAFNALGVSEAAAARALNFFVTGEAERFYDSQTSPGYLASGAARRYTWPHLVDAFLKRYLSDDALHESYAKVTHIAQKPGENEADFANRLSTAAQECNNVFTERALVHHYVNGLRPTTRSIVSEKLRSLPVQEQCDLTVVRRVALAEGNTYRARLKETGAKPKRLTLAVTETTPPGPARPHAPPQPPVPPHMPAAYRTPGSHVPTPPAEPYTPTWAYDESPQRSLDIVKRLDTIFIMVDKNFQAGHAGHDDELQRLINKPKEEAPVLTQEQRELAYSVIPADVWQLNCWGCREAGHSLFACPTLTPDQRLFYAYKYYLYKVQSDPSLAEFYKERLRERRTGITAKPKDGYRPGRYDQHYAANRNRGTTRPTVPRPARRVDRRPRGGVYFADENAAITLEEAEIAVPEMAPTDQGPESPEMENAPDRA